MTEILQHAEAADVAAVKRAATGKWPAILSTLARIPAEILDGKHHPCPRCGGKDRFRMIDAEAGAVLCNQCFRQHNGDGIAALQWLTDKPFPAVVNMVGDYLGMPSANGDGKASNSKAKRRPIEQLERSALPEQNRDTLIHTWTKTKPPITLDGAKRCGAEFVRWRRHRCVGLFGFHQPGERSDDPAAVILYRQDGRQFAATQKLPARKIHTVGGSKESWLGSGTVDELQAAGTIIKLEGPSDLMALVSAGLPDGHYAVTNVCGAKSIGNLDYSYAAGKGVLIIGDADTPGQNGAKRFARAFLKAGAADVRIPQLPYEVTPDHGKDLRDWLTEGHTVADFLALVEATAPASVDEAESWETKRATSKNGPQIIIGTDESRVVDEAIAALATRADIYQRGGCLVQIIVGSDPPRGIARNKDSPRIHAVRLPRLREMLADSAEWFRPTDEEPERVHPPDWAIKAVDARGQWQDIRRLEAVVETPILRADGTILNHPGYDADTGILFRPEADFPRVPDAPTKDVATEARDAVLEVVADFPFADGAYRSAYFAGLLTPFARYAFNGPAPLFLIDANVRGCGKSLLMDAAAVVATGREMPRMSAPNNDDEFRKRITAVALAGEPLIGLDNLNSILGCDSLDAALTATSWSDRILGKSEMASGIPLFATWYATGNNVILAADTARRTVHIRLESPEENPEERAGFQHPNLLAWVRQERPRLAVAAVTILAAYCRAGRPAMGLTPWGSFDAWSDLVREAIVWCGLPDPGATRNALTSQADREAVALRQLIAGWDEIDPQGRGMTVASVLKTLAEYPDEYEALRGALWELAPPRDGKTLNPRSIGMKLHHLRHRVIAGRFLDRRDRPEGVIWSVAKAEPPGTTRTKGTILSPSRVRACAHAQEPRRGRN